MDDREKSVLRRRRAHIINRLQLTDDLLQELKSRQLIALDVARDIMREGSNAERVGRLVDSVISAGSTYGFAGFCAALASLTDNDSCVELAHELQHHMRLERGEVKPRQEFVDDANSLLHRKFGASKRISLRDKRELATFIAAELEMRQTECQHDTQLLHAQLDETKSRLRDAELSSRHVYETLRDFVRNHETLLTSHTHDMTTTAELLRQTNKRTIGTPVDDSGALDMTDSYLGDFLKQVETALNQNEFLRYEKDKCLRLLGVDDAHRGTVQLDKLLSDVTGLCLNADMTVQSKDDIIARLEDRVTQLDQQAAKQQSQLETYRKQLADRDREISRLRRNTYVP